MTDAVPGGHPPAAVRRAIRIAMAATAFVLVMVGTGGRPDRLFVRGPFSSDFYDAQAHAMLHGRLDVDPRVASLEGYVHDGKTYLYFGLTPAVLRLPVDAVTHRLDGRLALLSIVVALTFAVREAGRLAWRTRRLYRGDRPPGPREPWVVGAFVAAAGLSSPLLFLVASPLVYHEDIAWGVALTLWSFDRSLAWYERPDARTTLLAGVAALAAVNARPSVGVSAVVALGVLVLLRARRTARPLLAGGMAACVVPVLVYMAVNTGRFGKPVSVPWSALVFTQQNAHRRAVLAANGGSLFSVRYVPTTLLDYLRPDGARPQRLFPFIGYRGSVPIIGHPLFDTIDRAASLPTLAPVLVVLAVIGVVAVLRHKAWPWTVVGGAAVLAILPTIAIGFVANRYLSDFAPALVVFAALGVWPVATVVGRAAGGRQRAAIAGLVALAVVGAVIGGALAVQSQRLYLFPTDAERAGFVDLQYRIDDALTNGPAPDVRRVTALPVPAPPSGTVAVVGDCAGVYWSDGETWRALERSAPFERRLRAGSLPAGGELPVVIGPGWSLSVRTDGGRARFVYTSAGRSPESSSPVPLDHVVAHDLRVVTDPSTATVEVWRGEQRLFAVFLADASGPTTVGPAWTERNPGTPLCRRLLARGEPAQAGVSAGSSS